MKTCDSCGNEAADHCDICDRAFCADHGTSAHDDRHGQAYPAQCW